jgi:dihydroorotase
MVDFGFFHPARPFQELVLKRLRPGDIYTHLYLGRVPTLDDHGRVLPYLFEARKRGVIFDAGHGAASLLFRQAVPAIRQGFPPDSISTDIHSESMLAGMKDMLNVMSKFLNMGMSFDDVILRSTWNPAREIRREELGNLSVGAPADIAVLKMETGAFGFVDAWGARMDGDRRLECELTIHDGLVVYDRNGITRQNWNHLGFYQAPKELWWDATIP